METINDRIRTLRKSLGLSQTDFAAKLGCGRGAIKNIEELRTEARPEFIDLLCRIYTVDPIWLETGEGEMFRKKSRQEQIADFVGKALADDSDDFVRQTIAMLAALDEAGWQKLKAAAEAIAEAQKKAEE